MKLVLVKPDVFGAVASFLCVVHCVATPFLFVAQVCSLDGCETSPIWWSSLDYIFLIISYFAVARSTKNSSKLYIKSLLWINWFSLLLLIVNEKFQFVSIPETITYLTALSLAVLHLYNLKFCQCKNNTCCS
ncbi:MerC domain-containing protein [Algibacter pectinivorans]|uniref:MerC mercury resistance protein n=1 Tax=Algibacter pectinivorans TaxID=870482 RepID=A0A1I1P9W2_9FLAO|nr:MerC domain-containing protein [Algibacter pectinivorans]SFD03793.1 MerC mercury resistance protein [Algibacter pectinivorans]